MFRVQGVGLGVRQEGRGLRVLAREFRGQGLGLPPKYRNTS